MQNEKVSREEAAKLVESYLKKAAGVIRNLILEGANMRDIQKSERVSFWMDKANDLVRNLETV